MSWITMNNCDGDLQVKDISNVLTKSVKDESLLARDFEFAFFMKVGLPFTCADIKTPFVRQE